MSESVNSPAMMPTVPAALCEVHVHIGGCLEADDVLELIAGREIDWSPYEVAFTKAYGRPSGLAGILADVRAGVPGARARFAELFVFGDASAGDFDRFSANFRMISCASVLNARSLALGFGEAGRRECAVLVDRVARNARAQGIGHVEVRAMLSSGVPAAARRQVLHTLLTEMLRRSGDGLTIELTPSLPRDDPFPMWDDVAELARSDVGVALTGVDFCHVEEGFPPGGLVEWAGRFHRFNAEHPDRALALLYHVGESYRDKSLASAIRWCDEAATVLGAHRLGHAIALGIDPRHHRHPARRLVKESVAERRAQIHHDLRHLDALRAAGVPLDADVLRAELRHLSAADPHAHHVLVAEEPVEVLVARQRFAIGRIRATGAVVEVCPTSNHRIAGFTDPTVHQVHRFIAEGLPFVIGADDPGILATTLADEFAWLRRHSGLDEVGLTAVRDRAWAARSRVLSRRGGAPPG